MSVSFRFQVSAFELRIKYVRLNPQSEIRNPQLWRSL